MEGKRARLTDQRIAFKARTLKFRTSIPLVTKEEFFKRELPRIFAGIFLFFRHVCINSTPSI